MAEHIILFVEGDTDEVLFKKIIARYKELANYESNIICHIDNLKGVSKYTSKAKGRLRNYYFRFSSVRLNRLRNKLLANYLKSGGNELATVRISAFCVAMLSNNSFICKYSIFFRKYELSAAVL